MTTNNEAMCIFGVPVIFPFTPYPIQITYMERVIRCLRQSTNAVLESPTGTGKSLSLLCSSLAWLLFHREESDKNYAAMNDDSNINMEYNQDMISSLIQQSKGTGSWGKVKIIYSSRTHSQLSQVIQELRRTSYQSKVKACVIGSRDQLCIKKEVLEEPSNSGKVTLCRSLVKNKQCSFYHGVEYQKNDVLCADNIVDIEDLVKMGQQRRFCPYYMAREAKSKADIIFMPYNYLLDTNSRSAHDIDLSNSVIIFDEAHNIEKMCEEALSMQFSSTNLTMAIEEITYLMKKMMEEEEGGFSYDDGTSKDFTPDDLSLIKGRLLNLEHVIDKIDLKKQIYEGTYIQTILEQAGINDSNSKHICSALKNVIAYLTTTKSEVFTYKCQNLDLFNDLFSRAFTNISLDKIKQCFKVYIEEKEIFQGGKSTKWNSNRSVNNKTQKVINWWCFSPSFGMDILCQQNVRSIILTSGTLAPLHSLITELGIEVPIRLENRHIIKKEQLLISVLQKGHNEVRMDPSYNNRNDTTYINSLGNTIYDLAKVIPDGLLVFFPSYPILEKNKEIWQQGYIWNKISTIKPIFVEPRGKSAFNMVMEEYYQAINAPGSTGACFFAVCRGKVAEGLDFADKNGRGVIITGLPFPPTRDPKVNLKKMYLNENKKHNQDLVSGNDWYVQEATRAMNQAIGRVIRHRHDWGAIFLCDERCAQDQITSRLSKWLAPNLLRPSSYSQALETTRKFFNSSCIQELKPYESKKSNIRRNNEASNTMNSVDFKEKPTHSKDQYAGNEGTLLQYLNPITEQPLKKKNSLLNLENNFGEIKDFNSSSNFHNSTVSSISEVRQATKKRKIICEPIIITSDSD